MSGTTLRMFMTFGGILAVFWAAQHVANVENASVDLSTAQKQMLSKKYYGLHTQKARGPLNSTITLVGSAVNASGVALVLQATVVTSKEVKDAKAKWVLPVGVTLVSGSADVVIPLVTPDKPLQVQITVEQKDFANQQIHFVVSGEQPGVRFSSVSQYNTKDEEFLHQQKDVVIKTLNSQKQDKKKAGHMFH